MQSRFGSPEFHHHARLLTIAGVVVVAAFLALRLELPRTMVAVLAALAVGMASATMSRVLLSRRG
jgi:hypothetical protein